MRAAVTLLPLMLLGATAPRDLAAADQAALAKALAGLTPGQPLGCIPLSYPVLNTRAIGPVLLYSRPNGTVYVNRTAGGCEGAANGDILVQVEYGGRPCSGDIIRTIEPLTRVPTGSCALGQFVPYAKMAR